MTMPIGHAATATHDHLAELHREHYRSLVRLAYLLLNNHARAEEVVQDAFVKLQLRWGGLRDLEKAPAYLRSAVLNEARSVLRHRKVVDRYDARRTAEPPWVSPESEAVAGADHDRIVGPCADCPTANERPSPCGTTLTSPRRRWRPPWVSPPGR